MERLSSSVNDWRTKLIPRLVGFLDGPIREEALEAFNAQNVARSGMVVRSAEGPRFVPTDFTDGSRVIAEIDEVLGGQIPDSEMPFREEAAKRRATGF